MGWGGDIAKLISDLKEEKGELTDLLDKARNQINKNGNGGFNQVSLIADLDAPIFLSKKNDANTFADIIKSYYEKKEYLIRKKEFIKHTFPNLLISFNVDKYNETIFNKYREDSFLRVLEVKYKVFLNCDNQRYAAVYAFAEYLSKDITLFNNVNS